MQSTLTYPQYIPAANAYSCVAIVFARMAISEINIYAAFFPFVSVRLSAKLASMVFAFVAPGSLEYMIERVGHVSDYNGDGRAQRTAAGSWTVLRLVPWRPFRKSSSGIQFLEQSLRLLQSRVSKASANPSRPPATERRQSAIFREVAMAIEARQANGRYPAPSEAAADYPTSTTRRHQPAEPRIRAFRTKQRP